MPDAVAKYCARCGVEVVPRPAPGRTGGFYCDRCARATQPGDGVARTAGAGRRNGRWVGAAAAAVVAGTVAAAWVGSSPHRRPLPATPAESSVPSEVVPTPFPPQPMPMPPGYATTVPLAGAERMPMPSPAAAADRDRVTDPTSPPDGAVHDRPPAAADDPVRTALEAEKSAYQKAIADARQALLTAIDGRADAATADGDLSLVRTLQSLRQGVVAGGPPPAEATESAVPAAQQAYDLATRSAKAAVVAAYRQAVRDHTRARQLDAALNDRRELDGLGLAVPSDAAPFGGHGYKAFRTPTSWDAARRACEQMGGHLAHVESRAEHDFVWKLAGRANCWLGARRTAAGWRWDDGATLAFTHWGAKQPDNSRGTQDALYIWTGDGRWDDGTSTDRYGFVCEWDEPPQ
jgi:hypothetical protein